MRFYLGVYILLTAVVIEVSCDCGVALPPADSPDTLEDGIDASIFPWHVEIYRENYGGLALLCPATLISSDVVITAITCLNKTSGGIDLTQLFVVTGNYTPRWFRNTRIEKYEIQTLHQTSGYPATSDRNSGDLAWLILRQPINMTSSFGPACIDLENRHDGGELPAGTVGLITYRAALEEASLPLLRKMKIIPFSHDDCEAIFTNDRRQNSSLNPSCARLSKEIESAHDVIGGGFYVKRNGRWYVTAIMTDVFILTTRKKNPRNVALFMNVERYADEIDKLGIMKRYGRPAADVSPSVAHELQIELGSYPWHASIYQMNSTGFYDQMCGGSLITSKVVISAAHCFYDEVSRQKQNASSFTVAVGKLYRHYEWPERFVQKSPVLSIHLPSRYIGSAGNHAGDIAWLISLHPFFNSALVMPIRIDYRNLYRDEDLRARQFGKVVGWGRTEAGVLNDELQEVHLPFIPYDRCISALPQDFKPFVTPDKFCAGYPNGTGVCDGDSGGGLAFRHSGLWYLRGIVSLSPLSEIGKCPNSYTAFTDIGQFIDEHQRIVNISTHGSN